MQIARLWNQHGAFCREWKGANFILKCLDLVPKSLEPLRSPNAVELIDIDCGKSVAILVLNGHSLVIEDLPEEETA